ncbi:hypothetical protein JS756_35065 [Streptomyces actuosus]|uniref:Secreted protein n=1 Tax=Streptomyces actuosus TaxID=1885 RepID=A0ABS2W198_STRAS|nr:hypothetical protein [Streptomyces actuosus]MBN0049197.1 hypothetical protein [Streptomyces actuosus]
MTQRGRHRRRRRGRALRACLAGTALALTAAATMISASQATVADDPGPLTRLASTAELEKLQLAEEPVARTGLDRLAAAMGRPVGVTEVLAGADHTLRTADACPSDDRRSLPTAPAATRAYCFGAADTRSWRPGAVALPADRADGRWDGHRVLVSAWSHGSVGDAPAGDTSGAPDAASSDGTGLARVAFIDAGDQDHLAYTWALLAVPVDGGRDYRALSSPVSGMVWYRDKLLVTADGRDGRALYVYDVDRVQRAGVDSAAVGRVPGGWSAGGARFVLPAVGSYRLTGDARIGSIALDRTTSPDSLVASEGVPEDSRRPTRLWRYSLSLDPARAGLPSVDPRGRAVPDAAYETKVTDVRGVLARGPVWYVTAAAGNADGHGMLWRLDGSGGTSARCGPDDTRQCWSAPAGPLTLTEGTGAVWSQSGRMLFSLGLNSIDSSQG